MGGAAGRRLSLRQLAVRHGREEFLKPIVSKETKPVLYILRQSGFVFTVAAEILMGINR
jgi:hypothetical protein